MSEPSSATAGIPDPTQGRSDEEVRELLRELHAEPVSHAKFQRIAPDLVNALPALLGALSGVRVELDQAREELAKRDRSRDKIAHYRTRMSDEKHGRIAAEVERDQLRADVEAGLQTERATNETARRLIARLSTERDVLAVERGRLQRRIDGIEANARTEAEKHQPDEKRGGCTCGFCAWSVEHVVIMAIRAALAAAPADPPIDVSCGAFIEGPFPGDDLAGELRGLAEQWLYDGDRDRPLNDGYGALLAVADRLAVPAGQENSDELAAECKHGVTVPHAIGEWSGSRWLPCPGPAAAEQENPQDNSGEDATTLPGAAEPEGGGAVASPTATPGQENRSETTEVCVSCQAGAHDFCLRIWDDPAGQGCMCSHDPGAAAAGTGQTLTAENGEPK